jgi:hypothetical protein
MGWDEGIAGFLDFNDTYFDLSKTRCDSCSHDLDQTNLGISLP